MSIDDQYSLNGEPLVGAHELSLPLARLLAAAADKNPDFMVQAFSRMTGKDGAVWEYIKVEVQTDGVPTRNRTGIEYREPLVLVVGTNYELPYARALRKSFPELMHQNLTSPGEPRELCLYFEPTKAVKRDWTPELFLRRIQWWLAQSAKGTLHAADQPVEQLFFVTKYELVLPWNFDELQKTAGQRFSIIPGEKRPDGGITFQLTPGEHPDRKPVSFVQLDLPAVVHSRVMRSADSLGVLDQQLQERGIDFLSQLKAKIQEPVGPEGKAATDGETLLFILLSIPIARLADGDPERTQRRAYVLLGSLLELGVKLGALMMHNGVYFRDTPLGGVNTATDWKSETLLPAEILPFNSRSAARNQAGLSDNGPIGTLVGAGALGGMLMMLWGRMGWGEWTVIDKDWVKPHNLSRHLAFHFQVGRPKVDVAELIHAGAVHDASRMKGINADATNLEDVQVLPALRDAELVVDASTTLEFPRLISTRDDLPRHASVFLTPNGRDSVLLIEDKSRNARLRTLEAQYYRALINNDFGADHLDGNSGTFWSGASCRDISVVMPYSLIVAHAGNLADQVRCAQLKEEARINIWKRDAITGAISVHDVTVEDEVQLQLDNLTLTFDNGVARRLSAMRAAELPSETGGVLLGYYDFNLGMVVIVDALPAPPDSKGTPGAFDRGKEGLAGAVEEASRRTARIVRYVGEWHSHPPGHSTRPSPDDRKQLAVLAQEMASDGLPVLQLIIGDKGISIYRGDGH